MKKLFAFILVFFSALLYVGCEEPHIHKFGEWVVVKEATETLEGSKERICGCGEKETEIIQKLEHTHTFGEWVVVKEATEEEAGLKERSCSCGEKETETVEKLGNSIESGFTLPSDGCEIRRFQCAYRSMKTEYDIDNVTLDFYYGCWQFPDIEYVLDLYDIPLFELYFKEAGGEKYLIKRVEENFISKKYYCDILEDGEYNINIIFNYSESITIPKEIFTKDSGLLYFQIYGKSIGKYTLENDYIAGSGFYYKVIGEKVLISTEPLK